MKEIRANKNYERGKDDELCDPGPSSSGNKHLKKKHASNIKNNKNRIQGNHFLSSDMDELRQPTTPLGVVNETLDETIVINENRHEDDYHMVTGPTKNILRQSSTNSNITDTQGPHADHFFS